MSNKKIAIVGARGIANYGGFETFVSELAPRLVKNGFEVYCSCEKDIRMPSKYKGANLIYFPIKMSSNYQLRKVIEFFYDIYFGLICSFKCDIIYFLGFSVNIFTFFPRLIGKKSFVNMAGVEWERSKFSKRERVLLKFFFKLSLIGSNHVIIDNKKLINYIDEKYHHKVIYITYGVNEISQKCWNQEIISSYTKFCVRPNGYWLAVARLQPDNNIETILNGFIKSESKKPLIIIGDFSCEIDYERSLKKLLNDNPNKLIIFTGGIYDQEHLNMFRQNCFGYIHAHSIGGTNPSLLEAMIMKNIVIANDNEFNREVARDAVVYFKNSFDLKDKLELIEKNPDNYLKLKLWAYNVVKENYSWNSIVDEYTSMFMEVKRR
jgi:rhamnosyltransferase